jgi:hypothetical protein
VKNYDLYLGKVDIEKWFKSLKVRPEVRGLRFNLNT